MYQKWGVYKAHVWKQSISLKLTELRGCNRYVSFVHLSGSFHLCISMFSWVPRLILKLQVQIYTTFATGKWQIARIWCQTDSIIWEIQRYIRLVSERDSRVSVLILPLKFQLNVQPKSVVWRRACQCIFVVFLLLCAHLLLFLSNLRYFILRFETVLRKAKTFYFHNLGDFCYCQPKGRIL